MAEHFDALERRDPEERERDLMSALPGQIALARTRSPYFAELLAVVEPAAVVDRAALAHLPVTRKAHLAERQEARPPFGGLAALEVGEAARIFMSPGPIYEPEGRRPDFWRMARALFAAGFRQGDVLHNSFAYHLTPAGAMLESGAHALGCAVVPAGVGNTELQLRAIADIRPAGYAGTPSFLKILVERAAEAGCDIGSLRKALVSGEAFPASLRAELAANGIAALQCYATADLGLIAYESPAQEGLILDERVIVEIVDPATGVPVVPGAVGEVVVTTLTPEYPLVRFATGDLSAWMDGPSPCGRTAPRIKGWMGRSDQAAKVRGLFVRPSQIAEVLRRHKEIAAARLIVSQDGAGRDRMVLKVAVKGVLDLGEVAQTLQALTKLRGTVELVEPAALPADGKVIDDTRPTK